ncbi:hypothetical protein B0H13DRAFT_1925369 [Mycena leptocephala]|nr:hypothetical protein B0H13DRAFT_1925369 [Mycena leptocephala]
MLSPGFFKPIAQSESTASGHQRHIAQIFYLSELALSFYFIPAASPAPSGMQCAAPDHVAPCPDIPAAAHFARVPTPSRHGAPQPSIPRPVPRSPRVAAASPLPSLPAPGTAAAAPPMYSFCGVPASRDAACLSPCTNCFVRINSVTPFLLVHRAVLVLLPWLCSPAPPIPPPRPAHDSFQSYPSLTLSGYTQTWQPAPPTYAPISAASQLFIPMHRPPAARTKPASPLHPDLLASPTTQRLHAYNTASLPSYPIIPGPSSASFCHAAPRQWAFLGQASVDVEILRNAKLEIFLLKTQMYVRGVRLLSSHFVDTTDVLRALCRLYYVRPSFFAARMNSSSISKPSSAAEFTERAWGALSRRRHLAPRLPLISFAEAPPNVPAPLVANLTCFLGFPVWSRQSGTDALKIRMENCSVTSAFVFCCSTALASIPFCKTTSRASVWFTNTRTVFSYIFAWPF